MQDKYFGRYKLKASYSADLILSLFSVYYNFVRIHQGIKMTPIEKAGIKLDLCQNKWLGLSCKPKVFKNGEIKK